MSNLRPQDYALALLYPLTERIFRDFTIMLQPRDQRVRQVVARRTKQRLRPVVSYKFHTEVKEAIKRRRTCNRITSFMTSYVLSAQPLTILKIIISKNVKNLGQRNSCGQNVHGALSLCSTHSANSSKVLHFINQMMIMLYSVHSST